MSTKPLHLLLTAFAGLVAGVALLLLSPSPAGAGFGTAPVNPTTAPNGATAMHGDSAASDTTPLPGPGTGALSVRTTPFAAACPSVLVGSDAMPIALCTKILGRAPQVAVLDPETGSALDTLDLPKGGLFSGVYTYLDDEDRLVLFDGRGDLLRIGHHRDASGRWRLSIDEREPLGELISGHCGGNGCDAVVGISPDWQGRVWFATGGGVVGLYDPRKDRGRALTLGKEEYVDNSISTAPGVTAVATDHALYELHAGRDGRPHVVWRRAYDRGPARKPGQLSWGTGATPTYFGPRTGAEYLAIVDNASPTEHLMVYRSSAKGSRRAAKPGSVVCRTPVLSAFGSGTENSPIGSGRSVIVASTYGYPYPAYPDHAGESVPASAPFTGGMARVDVRRRGRGCITRWESGVRSAAVPKLSLADELIYTVTRANPLGGSATSELDSYSATTVDPASGRVVSSEPLGSTTAYETLQLAGNIAPGGVLYQGTLTGIVRIEAAAGG